MKKNLSKDSKKRKIKFAGMVGEIKNGGARVLIPFNTSSVVMPKKELPLYANLVFEGHLDKKGEIEYIFTKIDLTCYCKQCS